MNDYTWKKHIDIIVNIIVLIANLYIVNIGIKTLTSTTKWYINTLAIVIYILWIYFFIKKNYEKRIQITKINLFIVGFAFLLFCIFRITMFNELIKENGVESTLNSYESMGKIIYFIICFLQPIILPLPEPITITAGNIAFGKVIGSLLGFLGTILGIITMFIISRLGSNKLKLNLINHKNLDKYNNLVAKNETFILILLFIFPILPDEIICIGAGLSPIKSKKFISIALISKLITIGAYSISSGIVKDILELGLGYRLIIITLIILLFIALKKLISYKKKSS